MSDKLYQELVNECDRLTKIINSEETGSDAWKLAYSKKLDILEKMQAFDRSESEYYAKQEERRITEEHNRRMLELEERKMEQHEMIEESRNEAGIRLEQEKQKITWKRVAFELGKLVIPLGISIVHYNMAQKKVFDFEEHGRITSTAGRELHLPKIFTK